MRHAVIGRLDALEAALAATGFPPLSPWWRDVVTDFYLSDARQLVLRCGRRAGKSSTLCRIAVLEGLYGEHDVPPGDVGIVGCVSVNRDESASRLRTIKAILDALGVPYRERDGSVELTRRRVVFKSFAATLGGVVGGTWIAAICDEVARWRDADSNANPASEVLGSLRPTLATMPNARLFLSSSPLGTEDAHAKAFDAGNSDFQRVAHAPTWLANPTLSEADCRKLEPDERIFQREYAAIPQAGSLACFDATAVARAFAHEAPDGEEGRRLLILDPSSGRKDAFSYAVACVVSPKRAAFGEEPETWRPYVRFLLVDGIEGNFWQRESSETLVDRLAIVAKEYGCESVHADQREAFALQGAFQSRRLPYFVHDWTAQSKPLAVERVRRRFAEGTIALPNHERLAHELATFEERFTASGALTFGARGSGHDDFVALLLTAALAEEAGFLVAAPVATLRTYRADIAHIAHSRFGSSRGF